MCWTKEHWNSGLTTGGLGWWKLDEKGMAEEGNGGQDEADAAPARRVMKVMICMLLDVELRTLLYMNSGIAPTFV